MWRLMLAVAALAAAAVVAGAALWWMSREADVDARVYPIPGEVAHLTVEVLNGAGIDGLAAATTRRLRRAGIDVVFYGTAPVDTVTATRILVRRGDTTMVGRIREVLGTGIAVRAPDSTLLLDVTVLLGSDAAPGRVRP